MVRDMRKGGRLVWLVQVRLKPLHNSPGALSIYPNMLTEFNTIALDHIFLPALRNLYTPYLLALRNSK